MKNVRIEGLVYYVAPEDAGQIVEVAYAAAGERGIVRRTTDRSDRSVKRYTLYEIGDWNQEEDETFEPWNCAPADRDWTEIDQRTRVEE